MGERRRDVRAGAAVVAVLVVLAGCNGLVPGSTDATAETPQRTLTPVPVETPAGTPTSTPEPATFAWLVDDGAPDMDALFDRHTQTLGNRSFTFHQRRRTSGATGPVATEYDNRVAVANDTTYTRRDATSASDQVVLTFIDPSGVYRRVESPDGSAQTMAVRGGAANARQRFAVLTASIVGLLFVTEDTRADTTERDGVRYARLFSRTPPEYLVSIYDDYNMTDFSATVWVHPDGYVRTFHYEFTLVNGTRRIQVDERYFYTAVGNTTVERPAWAEGLDPGGQSTPTATPASDTPTSTERDATGTPRGNRTTGTPGTATSAP
jgi:hypothetical protein